MTKSKKPLKRNLKDPPVTETRRTEIDPATGGKIEILLTRRGLLAKETRRFDMQAWWSSAKQDITPRQGFEQFCDSKRDELEARNLPSDRTPVWVKEPGGEFRPYVTGESLPPGSARQHWTKRLEQLTEPLSKERMAGELLRRITDLLSRPNIDEHLNDIGLVMHSYGDFRVAGRPNSLAYQAILANEARAKGPASRRRSTERARGIAMSHANALWSARAILRGSAINTASSIVDSVNADLRANGLRQLSVKTIAGYLSRKTGG